MNDQQRLLFETKFTIKHMKIPNLRGVIAQWKNDVAHLSFYFDGEISKKDIENASDASGEIIANFPSGFLNEEYIRLDYPQKLPDSEFWAYRKSEAEEI